MPGPFALYTAFFVSFFFSLSIYSAMPSDDEGVPPENESAVSSEKESLAETLIETAQEPFEAETVLPETTDTAPEIAGFSPPDVTRGDTRAERLSITFDGGYEGTEAIEILDILKERGIRTTIFLTGTFMKRFPEVAQRVALDGHEAGNHTMTHPHLTDFSRSFSHATLPGIDKKYLIRELNEAGELYAELTGKAMAPLWRAPYGEVNADLRQWAFEAGYIHVGWTYDAKRKESLDTLDWVSDGTSRLYRNPEEMKDRILNFGKDGAGLKGGIILMHLGTERKEDRASTALGALIDELTAKGYRLVKVSELIEGNAALKALMKGEKEFIAKTGERD